MRVHAAPQIILPSHRDRDLPRPPGRVPAIRRDVWATGISSHPGVTPHASAPLIAQQLHQLWALQGLGYNAALAADAYRRSAIPFAKDAAGDISITA